MIDTFLASFWSFSRSAPGGVGRLENRQKPKMRQLFFAYIISSLAMPIELLISTHCIRGNVVANGTLGTNSYEALSLSVPTPPS